MANRYSVGNYIGGLYEVHEIKQGGMGVVYFCIEQTRDPRAGPRVLKTLQDRFLRSEANVRSFVREAEIWLNLGKHENLVRAYTVIKVQEMPYVVLEWVVSGDRGKASSLLERIGASLRDRLLSGPIDLQRVLAWSIQISRGLEYANQQYKRLGRAFVHGDIKPENILIDGKETAKVTDFGITAALQSLSGVPESIPNTHADTTMHKRGSVCGTPAYMSPEQFTPGTAIDVRSDVYSFGCVLYELVGGNRPFVAPKGLIGSDVFNFYQVRHKQEVPRPLRIERQRCPETLANIIDKSLRKRPDERYGTFGELLEDLVAIGRQMGYVEVPPQDSDDDSEGSFLSRSELSELGYRCTEADVSASEWINRGHGFWSLGRYNDAASCYTRALEDDPQNETAWWWKAMSLGKLRQFEEVLVCIANAEKYRRWASAEKLADFAVMEASALAGLGRMEEAMRLFDEGLRLMPSLANGWYAKGTALLSAGGRQVGAIAAFQKARELKRDFYAAYTDEGLALWQLGRYEEADDRLRRALAINPRYPLAWLHLGNVHGACDDLEGAIKCFERALEIDPNFTLAAEQLELSLRLRDSS